ncbi:MAG: hypothetical protein AB7S65_10045 [Sulfuricurvum sp.]
MMSLSVKVNGGYADQHKISLDDIAILAKSIQAISRNYQSKNDEKVYTDIYISADRAGSYELLLELLNNPYVQGVGSAYLYDLSKEIKSFLLTKDKKKVITTLIDEIFSLALKLADEDYYDYRVEEKNQLLEKKERLLQLEYSTFNAINDISKLVKQSPDEESNKPDSISFSTPNIDEINEFSFNAETRKKIHEMSNEILELEEITVMGIPTNLSRTPTAYFKMKAPFFGMLKIHVEQSDFEVISDYFKKKEIITVKIKPILKIGEMIKTKEGKLTEIIEKEK